jgi:thiamine biosynthesis lipoprotein
VRIDVERPLMGTPFRIVACAPDSGRGAEAVDAAFARMREMEAALGDYDPEGEVARIARTYEPGVPVEVSADLARGLELAGAWWERTGGLFDASLGAMTRLWRRSMRRGALPDSALLAAARASSGWRHVRVDGRTATFLVAGIRLDFGGIGKGMAADEALRVLRSHGITRAVVDAGGDVVAGEGPPGAPGWIVALPEESGGGRVYLEHAALATSGDRYRHVEVDGVRYSHILDPESGTGRVGGRTVSVLAPDGAAADALATAVLLAGPLKAEEFVPDVARAVLVTGPDGGTRRFGRLPEAVPDRAPASDCGPGGGRLD